jgi:hypothetical protein
MDIVPIVFNIKPTHSESVTRPNIKHRLSAAGSHVASGAETPSTTRIDLNVPVHTESNLLQVAGPNALQAAVSNRLPIQRTLDEQADSAARKCIMYFGPGNNPRLSIGPRNQVTVDAAGKIHLLDDLDEYKKTVGKGTWNSVIKLADELREKKVKIAFFSSTPQGGKRYILFLT